MKNNLSSIGAEVEKDQCKGAEMRELNDRKIYFTDPLSANCINTTLLLG